MPDALDVTDDRVAAVLRDVLEAQDAGNGPDPRAVVARFPDLAGEGKKRDAVWLDKFLANPQAIKKGTFMPTFRITAAQRKALVAYLSSLGAAAAPK